MRRPLSVLAVEDSEADAELLSVELRRAGFDTTFERVATESELRCRTRIRRLADRGCAITGCRISARQKHYGSSARRASTFHS
jgi:hypothetical protein